MVMELTPHMNTPRMNAQHTQIHCALTAVIRKANRVAGIVEPPAWGADCLLQKPVHRGALILKPPRPGRRTQRLPRRQVIHERTEQFTKPAGRRSGDLFSALPQLVQARRGGPQPPIRGSSGSGSLACRGRKRPPPVPAPGGSGGGSDVRAGRRQRGWKPTCHTGAASLAPARPGSYLSQAGQHHHVVVVLQDAIHPRPVLTHQLARPITTPHPLPYECPTLRRPVPTILIQVAGVLPLLPLILLACPRLPGPTLLLCSPSIPATGRPPSSDSSGRCPVGRPGEREAGARDQGSSREMQNRLWQAQAHSETKHQARGCWIALHLLLALPLVVVLSLALAMLLMSLLRSRERPPYHCRGPMGWRTTRSAAHRMHHGCGCAPAAAATAGLLLLLVRHLVGIPPVRLRRAPVPPLTGASPRLNVSS